MDNLKEEGRLSSKHRRYVLACLSILLLSIAIVHHEYRGKTGGLSDALFIPALIGFSLQFFWKKKV